MRGAMKSDGILFLSTTDAVSSMLLSVVRSYATSVDAVLGETTKWYLISHQYGLIVTVVSVDPSTMSWENATIFPSNSVLLE